MKQRGFSLVGTLVAIALLVLLGVALMKGSSVFGGSPPARKDGVGQTLVGRSKASAEDVVCRSNLGQVRSSLEMLKQAGEELPSSLVETRLGDSMTRCPIGNEPYVYDPGSGSVRCVHPGHEAY